MKAVVYTLGCKTNSYESFSIMNDLIKQGYEVFSKLVEADLYIINTCAVTSEAERKSRQVLAKIEKLNPKAKVVICGCASEKNPAIFKDKNANVQITGTFGKSDIVKNLSGKFFVKEHEADYEDNFYPANVRTRAFIKVQDGCDNFCSYCIIPYLRGRSRSRSIESILNEINSLSDVFEIVLTAINLSDYGKNTNSSLEELVSALNNIKMRLRLGSLEVNVITPSFLKTLKANPNFCPHFHLSLQSGSDNILKAMNRHYSALDFLNAVAIIRDVFPYAGITTDIIAGFPGETDKDFEETVELCKKAAFADMHIFPYSKREGTKAYNLKPVDKKTIDERLTGLTALKQESINNFINKNIGQVYKILIEEFKDGYYTGYTQNYIKCYGKDFKVNTVVDCKILGAIYDGALIEEIKI